MSLTKYFFLFLSIGTLSKFSGASRYSTTDYEKYCFSYLDDLNMEYTRFIEKGRFIGNNAAHFVFQQTYRNIPIEQSYIYFHFYKDKPVDVVDLLCVVPTDLEIPSTLKTTVIKQIGNKYYPLHKQISSNSVSGITSIYYSGMDTSFVEYGNIHKQQKDTGLYTSIFYPNPIVSSGEEYGNDFRDNNDKSSTALENQQQELLITLKKDTQTNDLNFNDTYIRFENVSSPTVIFHANDLLNPINRSMPIFEAANVYYHINQYIKYLDTAGYIQLVRPLIIDPHAFNGIDNSAYTPYGLVHNLQFGTGGVDDAEDAQVIIHEFAHSLVQSASPYSRGPAERNSIEEGICDYLCMMYSNRLSGTAETNVFSWDGHNEFYPGFELNSKKNYVLDYTGDSNQDREIWSSILYNIQISLGDEIANTLVMEHLFYLNIQNTMPSLARDLLTIDEKLFNSKHSYILLDVFTEHGVVPIDNRETFYSATKDELKGFLTYNRSNSSSQYTIALNKESRYNVAVHNLIGEKLLEEVFAGSTHKLSVGLTSRDAILLIVVTDLDNLKIKPLCIKTFNWQR